MNKLLIALLMMSFGATTFAHGTRGGSGPVSVNTKEYPVGKIDKASKLIIKAVGASNLDQDFKNSILSELAILQGNKKFKQVRELIFLPEKNETSYELSHDSVLYLDSVTEHKKSSVVYLAAKTLNYDIKKLSTIILHEVLHHVLIYSLSQLEGFVDTLSNELMYSNVSYNSLRTMNRGILYTDGKLSAKAFFGIFWEKYLIDVCAYLKASKKPARCLSSIDEYIEKGHERFISSASNNFDSAVAKRGGLLKMRVKDVHNLMLSVASRSLGDHVYRRMYKSYADLTSYQASIFFLDNYNIKNSEEEKRTLGSFL